MEYIGAKIHIYVFLLNSDDSFNDVIDYFQGVYVIEYKRINHYDFNFLLEMRNPNMVEKKVIVRLWLVPTNIIFTNIIYALGCTTKTCFSKKK